METYEGYFQPDGRFIADNALAKIPSMRRAIVKIMDDDTMMSKAKKQRIAFDRFIAECAESEPLGEEYEEVIKEGIHFRNELDL
jgi:hypothetical protein